MEKDHTGKIVERIDSSDDYVKIKFTDGSTIEIQVRASEHGYLVFWEED